MNIFVKLMNIFLIHNFASICKHVFSNHEHSLNYEHLIISGTFFKKLLFLKYGNCFKEEKLKTEKR